MTKNTPAEDEAQQRIEAAIYALTRKQREDIDASRVRNIITDLWPAIVTEIRSAVTEQKEADAKIAGGFDVIGEPRAAVAYQIAEGIRAQ